MKWFLMSLLLLSVAAPCALAADEGTDDQKAGPSGASGQPLPRFASLRTNEVNLRTGPGKRYPIDWVFVKQGVPVEITAEYDVWRRVRDHDGTEGWVHKTALTGKRTAITIGVMHDLRRSDDAQAPVLAHLEAGASGQLLSCGVDWCQLKFNDIKGYLRKTEFWGAYPAEKF